MELEEQMSRHYREKFLHKEVEVLFEEEKLIDGKSYQVGHTREYVLVACETYEDLSGRIGLVIPTKFLQDDILM